MLRISIKVGPIVLKLVQDIQLSTISELQEGYIIRFIARGVLFC